MICLSDHRGKANTAVYVSLSRLGYVLTAVPRLDALASGQGAGRPAWGFAPVGGPIGLKRSTLIHWARSSVG
jgi:hypothetical protein